MEARKFFSKIKLLEIAEMLSKKSIYMDLNSKKEELGWLDSKLVAVAENLQVIFNEIHFRYEDTISSFTPFSLGVMLQQIHFRSVNEKWEDAIFETEQQVSYKILNVRNLAFYLRSENACQWKTIEELVSLLSAMLCRGEGVLASTATILPPTASPLSTLIVSPVSSPRSSNYKPMNTDQVIDEASRKLQEERKKQTNISAPTTPGKSQEKPPQVKTGPNTPQPIRAAVQNPQPQQPQQVNVPAKVVSPPGQSLQPGTKTGPNTPQPTRAAVSAPTPQPQQPTVTPTKAPQPQQPTVPVQNLQRGGPPVPAFQPKADLVPTQTPKKTQPIEDPLKQHKNPVSPNPTPPASVPVPTIAVKAPSGFSQESVSPGPGTGTHSPVVQGPQHPQGQSPAPARSQQGQGQSPAPQRSQQQGQGQQSPVPPRSQQGQGQSPAPSRSQQQPVQDPNFSDFILTPVSGVFKVRIDRREKIDYFSPRLSLEVLISSVQLRLLAKQFQHTKNFLQWSSDYKNRLEFISVFKFRPKIKTEPIPWWQYAYKCVLLRVRQKKLQWTSQYYTDKDSYCTLYSKLLSEGKLPDKEKEALQVLEKKYDLEQLLWFRKWTHAKICVTEKREAEKSVVNSFKNWWSSDSNKKEEAEVFDLNREIHLVLAIATNGIAVEYPPNYVQSIIRVILTKLDIEIHDASEQKLLSSVMHNMDVTTQLRSDLTTTLQKYFGAEQNDVRPTQETIVDHEWQDVRKKIDMKVAKKVKATEEKYEEKYQQILKQEEDLKKHYEVLAMKERLIKEEQARVKALDAAPQSDWITLNVGGESFQTALSTLTRNASMFQAVAYELYSLREKQKEETQQQIQLQNYLVQIGQESKKAQEEIARVYLPEISALRDMLQIEIQKRSMLEKEVNALKRGGAVAASGGGAREKGNKEGEMLMYQEINTLHGELASIKQELKKRSNLELEVQRLKEIVAGITAQQKR